MLCTSTPCRRLNVQATHALRWSPPLDPPGSRPRDVIEGHYCDACAESIRGRGQDVVLLDEPVQSRTLDVQDLRLLAANATDELLTYEALRLRGLPHQTAKFVAELVDSWPLLLDAINGGPTPLLERLREEVVAMHPHFGLNSQGVPMVMLGNMQLGPVSSMPELTELLRLRWGYEPPVSEEGR